MRRTSVARFCALFSLPAAMLLTSGAAYAEEPSSAAPNEAQAAPKCRVVHIDADPLYGIEADDVVLCDEGLQKLEPGERPVLVRINYDLPVGTRVTYAFDHTSSNCISNPFAASPVTETIAKSGRRADRLRMFDKEGDFLDRCGYERSWASWNITAVGPSGVSKTANIRIVTGTPSTIIKSAEVTCHFVNGLGCTGGSDISQRDDDGTGSFSGTLVPLKLGPLDSPPPPPRAPELICTGTAHLSVGKPMETQGGRHPCTIEGYPLPTVDIVGLPPGITLTRWPGATDTWLVLHGTLNQPFFGAVEVRAKHAGWADTKYFWLNVN